MSSDSDEAQSVSNNRSTATNPEISSDSARSASGSGTSVSHVYTASELMDSSSAQPQGRFNSSNKFTSLYYLKGLSFIILVSITSAIAQYFYTLAHGIDLFQLFYNNRLEWDFDWLGGSSNPSSVGIEIFVWTIMGVSAKTVYQSAQDILGGNYLFFPSIISWISKCFYAWGIGVAVVLFFSVISVTVVGIEITLSNASISTIIAIAFIIGFYDDEALRVIGRIRNTLSSIIYDWGRDDVRKDK